MSASWHLSAVTHVGNFGRSRRFPEIRLGLPSPPAEFELILAELLEGPPPLIATPALAPPLGWALRNWVPELGSTVTDWVPEPGWKVVPKPLGWAFWVPELGSTVTDLVPEPGRIPPLGVDAVTAPGLMPGAIRRR